MSWADRLLSIGAGLLGAGGTAYTNRANVRMAREQMNFQERMANTSAQRAVEDYRRAGLNPALAYDRGASAPGGASATLGDVASAGLSSAADARRLRAEMRSEEERRSAEIKLLREQAGAAEASNQAATNAAMSSWEDVRLKRQAHAFNLRLQPHQERFEAAKAIIEALRVPGARNTAAFEEKINTAPLSSARTISEILKTLSGIRR